VVVVAVVAAVAPVALLAVATVAFAPGFVVSSFFDLDLIVVA